jgi:hypothetical protein
MAFRATLLSEAKKSPRFALEPSSRQCLTEPVANPGGYYMRSFKRPVPLDFEELRREAESAH